MKRERSCCQCKPGRRSVLDRVLPERLETTILDDGVMRGTQIDAMWDFSIESFQPGLDAHTPGVTGLQSRKIVFPFPRRENCILSAMIRWHKVRFWLIADI